MGPTYTTTVDLSTSNGQVTVANVSGATAQLTAVSFLSGPKGDTGATGAKGDTGATGAAGSNAPSDHTLLSNIGTNTHAQIDTKLATSTTHIADTANPHSVTKTQVGLSNVDNTSDASKPVSTATATALAGKAATSHTHAESDVTNLVSDLAAKAPLASPTFTGTPTAPTATAGTSTTQLATTAFVNAATVTLKPSGDTTGAADTTAINASLIANAHTKLAPGNWYVTNVGLVTNDRWLQGSGLATILNVVATYTGLTITGPGRIRVSDLTFMGGAYGMYVNGAYDAVFSNLYFNNQTSGGIKVNGDAATEQHYADVVMRGVNGIGFDLERTTSIYTGSLYMDRVRIVQPAITATYGFKFNSTAGSASLNIAFMTQCVADNYYGDACYVNNCSQIFATNCWFAINGSATAGATALRIIGGFQQSYIGCYTYTGITTGKSVIVSGAISGISIGGGHVFDGGASSTALGLSAVTTGFNLGTYQNYCGTLTDTVAALSYGGQASSPPTFYTSSTGGASQNIAIIDTANPSGNTKYIRNSNGALEVVNSAFSAPILTLSNAGILGVSGLSGTPTAPTAAVNTNTTQIASTAFVQQELQAVAGVDQVTGEQTIPRYAATADYIGPSSGTCTFMYFTAHSNQLVSQATAVVGSTAKATATLIRFGLYTVAANGDMTLVASTPNDTTLFGSSYTPYSKNLSANYTFIKGQRYAAAILEVATTPANLYGAAGFVSNAGKTPRICATKTGLSDLPSTQTDATLTGNNEKIFWIAYT